ncbi:MAG: fibronectin type III-like domain-contianing protein, partial [Acidobacteria bacterium]|nr:fibronectin type III-like domain-contianing protein [Acidobacteriota bacterium]
QKVWLAPGETKTVALEIPVKELSYWSPVAKKVVLEPGDFDLWAGFDATATEHKSFHVTAGK